MALLHSQARRHMMIEGSNLFFYASTSAGPRGWWWNPSLKGEGFYDPRGLADVSVSENHVWSLLLHKVHFVTWKLWKTPLKSSFLHYYNGAQKHAGFVGFENACSRVKNYVILTSLNYVHFYARYCWWRQLLWRPRMRICKVQKPCINSTWIAWLIHGFCPFNHGC